MPEDGLVDILRSVVEESLLTGGINRRKYEHGLLTEQKNRLRVRSVAADSLVERAVALASDRSEPYILAAHGGSVPNTYKYPATTEGVLVVAWPGERWWRSNIVRVAAHGTTLARVVNMMWFDGVPYVDRRYGEKKQQEARDSILHFAVVCVVLGIGKTNIDINSILKGGQHGM